MSPTYGAFPLLCQIAQAARVVVTWLKHSEEAEERRKRAAEQRPVDEGSDGGGASDGTSGEEDDEDSEEFVYDIQVSAGGTLYLTTMAHIVQQSPFIPENSLNARVF